MEILIIVLLVAYSALQVHKCAVLRFKCSYYKQRMDNNNLRSSVEGVKTIFDVVKSKDFKGD